MSKKLRPSQSQFDCPLKKRDFEFGPVLPALDCQSTGACLGSQYHLIPFKEACLVVGSWLNTRKGCVLNISVPGG